MKFFLFILCAALFWGLNYHLAQFMMDYCTAIEAGFWRYLLGVIPLAIIGIRNLPSISQIIKVAKGILLTGILGLFGFNYLFFLGLSHTSAMNAVLIMTINPAITAAIAWPILGERLSGIQLLGLLIALGGVVSLLTGGALEQITELKLSYGDFIIFGAAILFALHNIWVKIYAKHTGILSFTFLTNLLCLLGFCLLISFQGFGEISGYSVPFWTCAFGMGVLGTALAYFLWNAGISAVGATRGAVFLNITPAFTAVFALLFGQEIYAHHLWNGLIIILGVILVQIRRH